MNNKDIFNSKSAKTFARGSLWIIGLSVALSYVLATLVILLGEVSQKNVFVLICILAIVQIIVSGVFLWRAKLHCADLCSKHDAHLFEMRILEMVREMRPKAEETRLKKEHDEHLLKMRKLEMAGETCREVAKAIKLDSGKNVEAIQKLLKEMLDQFSKISSNEDVKNSGT
jgi:hypothetical protein